jgi:formylglycine-generating enzyme required for sulfatase activity
MKQTILHVALLLVCAIGLRANNIQTANVLLTGQNTSSNYTQIAFDISWENSWRTSTNESNYDGAWIFAKFRKKNTSLWQHATINYVSPGNAAACGHVAAAGATLKTSSDGKGVWMYRDADGIGAVNWQANSIQWNYGADGVLDADSVEIRLFAVEMVYIPQGSYNLGSGGVTETARFRDGATDTYLSVNSENAIVVGNAAGNIYGYGNTDMAAGSIPAAFPKGYNAFWIMKHEITIQAYADFLNCLDLTSSNLRNPGGIGGSGIHPALQPVNPERPMELLSTVDLLSWLDWTAMRPFTELEYEKACRGANILPIADEYAWGNTTVNFINTASNSGTSSETYAVGNCNYYPYIVGTTMRVGALATNTSTRASAGATYYGVLEMSGNVSERAVAAGYSAGRAFTGVHGNGALNISATYDIPSWPLNTGSGLTFKGGSFNDNSTNYIRISDRTFASSVSNVRTAGYGGRGARTAE